MIFFGERRFRAAVSPYVEHYHTERAHHAAAADGAGVAEARAPGALGAGGYDCSMQCQVESASVK